MSRTVVIWSGGLDSTLCLYLAGFSSTKEDPIFTYSIRSHYLINKYQTTMQTRAMKNYLKWARGLGHYIKPVYLDVSGNIHPDSEDEYYFEGNDAKQVTKIRQRDVFSTTFAPYFNDGDKVIWGWRGGEVPEQSFFNRLKALSLNWQSYQAEVKHICPLGNIDSDGCISLIKAAKIPSNCVYCCDYVDKKTNKICTCVKCERMKEVYPELMKNKDRIQSLNYKIAQLKSLKASIVERSRYENVVRRSQASP